MQACLPVPSSYSSFLPSQLWIYIIPAGVGSLLSFFYIRSKPPAPLLQDLPSESTWSDQTKSFFKGLWKVLYSLSY